MGSRLNFQKY